MHLCPRDPNALWDRVASEVKQDCVSGRSDLCDLGPSQHRPERDPIAAEQSLAPQFANVQTIAGQLLDREGW
jgi:hypothetical protein